MSWLHAGEVASAFIQCVSREQTGAHVFDINGVVSTVAAGVDMIKQIAPNAQINIAPESFRFRTELSDEPLRAHIGNYGSVPLAVGIEKTYHAFRELLAQGKRSADNVARKKGCSPSAKRSQKSLSVTHQPHTVGVAAELPATVYPAVGKIEEQAIYRFFCAGAIPIGHGARKDLAVDSGVRTVRRDNGLEFVHGGQTPPVGQARVGLRVSKFLQITEATGTVFPLLTAAAAHPGQVRRLVVHHLTIYGESRGARFFFRTRGAFGAGNQTRT